MRILKAIGNSKVEKSSSNKSFPLPIAKSPARKNSRKEPAKSNFDSFKNPMKTPTMQIEKRKR